MKGAPGFYVMSRECDECLFTTRRIVDGERAAEVIAKCKRSGRHFICHKVSVGCCRGFYDRFPDHPNISAANALIRAGFGVLHEIDPPGKGE